MKQLLWAECRKMRRSKMLWISSFATMMVAIIVFAQGQFMIYGSRYIDVPEWFMKSAQSLATFYVFPAIIALFGCYMICREEQEDVLKSLKLIPVNENRLNLAKIIITFIFSIFMFTFLFVITGVTELLLHFKQLNIAIMIRYLFMYLLDGACIFCAIVPFIAIVAYINRSYWIALVITEVYSFGGLFASMSESVRGIYPITATFQISGYYEANMFQILVSIVVMVICLTVGILICLRKKTNID